MAFKMLAWTLPFFLVLTIVVHLLPTTKEMAVIYVVPKVVNNAQVQAMPGKLLDLADEWIDKLKPEKDKLQIEKPEKN